MDKKFKVAGTVKFKTKYSFVAPPPPPLNKEGMNYLMQGVSTLKTRVQTEGMKANFQMKIEKFNAINLEARNHKLMKEEQKTLIELNRRIKD